MRQLFKTSVFLLLAFLLPATALAYSFQVDGIYYDINDIDEVYVTYKTYSNYHYVSDYSGDVVIPSTVTYDGTTYNVTAIGYCAFSGCSDLTSVTIPNSVTGIDVESFYGCSSLTDIEIPNSITTIGDYAFCGCNSLTNVILPNSINFISNGLFYECGSLTSIEIPNSVTEIGAQSFYCCSSLTSVIIGSSVSSIGVYAFYGCSEITDLIWNARNCSSNGDMSTSNIERVAIGDDVKVLPSNFVRNSKITSVIIPDSVTTIGGYAFSGCI